MIVGATNVENVLDVTQLAPGHAHRRRLLAALPEWRRPPSRGSRSERDILFTEGGFVRSGAPMPRIAHVPAVD